MLSEPAGSRSKRGPGARAAAWRRAAAALLVCACAAVSPAQAAPSIFACEPHWASLAREIAGERGEVFSAIHPGQDPHHAQARPSLIAGIRTADLLICNGAGLEAGWLPLLLRRGRNPNVLPGGPGHLMAADHLTLMEVPEVLDRGLGHIHPRGNPHVQLSPDNILIVAELLAERLARIAPEHAAHYGSRMRDFRAGWIRAMDRWRARARGLEGAAVVVHHQKWGYLLDWLGMRRLASLEPKPGVPPSSGHLVELRELVRRTPPLAIVRSPIDDPRPSQWLSDRAGVPVVVLPHTVDGAGTGELMAMFDAISARLLSVGR